VSNGHPGRSRSGSDRERFHRSQFLLGTLLLLSFHDQSGALISAPHSSFDSRWQTCIRPVSARKKLWIGVCCVGLIRVTPIV
jgi:hypothetical protein